MSKVTEMKNHQNLSKLFPFLDFNGPCEVDAIMRTAKETFGFASYDPEDKVLMSEGEDFILEVCADTDEECRPVYRAQITTFCPRRTTASEHHPSIKAALDDLKALIAPTRRRTAK